MGRDRESDTVWSHIRETREGEDMGKKAFWLKTDTAACILWIALCFGMTSAAYISWVYRLLELGAGGRTEWISLVGGYLCQAGGTGLAVFLFFRRPEGGWKKVCRLTLGLFSLVLIPALFGSSLYSTVLTGLIVNVLCGIIAGCYLHSASAAEASCRSRVFGAGYAAAILALALPFLTGTEQLLSGSRGRVLCIVLCASLILLSLRLPVPEGFAGNTSGREKKSFSRALLLEACAAVFLISLVKSLGFAFPSSEIEAGLKPELSRLPYALGLLGAGMIYDRNRKNGLILAIGALIIPFIMMDVAAEPVPGLIKWGLEYLFFGVFSVFRVILFLDLAAENRCAWLAPLGLLTGRVGDAAGTGISLVLAGSPLAMIAAAAVLFFPAVFLLIRLSSFVYETEKVPERNEQEVFEKFCLRWEISSREKDVLRLVIAGRTNREIAEELFIVEGTVKYHVRNVLHKTDCRNREELQKKYMEGLYPGLSDSL